ncbi:X-Pro dipeptidyl-peptidase [Cordyceps fumosorosea ARSEF 2679]|uniref:X-Pro dipeptidyl-peptidase n=1 Tax=Cordyceps fumosorosea (strain ARSEF 2679) TaxID=1081104 RepID=A0A167QMB9_CORFA|nr:X-Pro dipeptidyl-peptidase [Cordyceps fumosorosea ARSEF 2679]OAA57770.1 X-Pro dipeptidyl-peptidase [Cordyceps fumosorosea ARSEF 2679]
MDAVWVARPVANAGDDFHESMPDRVRRVGLDIEELENYYRVSVSPQRHARLRQFLSDELDSLFDLDFQQLSKQDQVDFLQLRNHLDRTTQQLQAERELISRIEHLFPFSDIVVELSEAREAVKPLENAYFADQVNAVAKLAQQTQHGVVDGKLHATKTDAFKASKIINELQKHLEEIRRFFGSYDPSFDWWVTAPLKQAVAALREHKVAVERHLVGIGPDGEDEIIGQPIGREALLVELEAEMIAYSPEELLNLADEVFRWCETQMKTASCELGFGDDWKRALDYVKTQHVAPGEQPALAKALALEGAAYVKKHDLVTVPRVADETYRANMMPAALQKTAPFFLGGSGILIAYPLADMDHDLKRMVLRGNNRHFARATVFHELVPGHRLQYYYNGRYNSHRRLFSTPFWIEGWALYWELRLWDRGDFFASPEDRVGTLFWRMHRCARIVFSLRFHLGEWSPQRCVDLLVDGVGHERATAEAEVRRSFAGDYPPLYQAGYLLGALQFDALRGEVLREGSVSEKQFHDAILRGGSMAVEMVRALLLDLPLSPDYKPHWRFYKK